MQLFAVQGMIERRILVNYRVAPSTLATLIPAPFRPQIKGGFGVAGICLIRLSAMRPRCVPACLGISSENAAHRIAVEWDDAGQTRRGVFVVRRDTASAFNVWAGGRLFPGVHERARFTCDENQGHYHIDIQNDPGANSRSGAMHVSLRCAEAESLPRGSIFSSLADASEFFAQGAVGYSSCAAGQTCEGLELQTFDWNMRPLAVSHFQTSFFDDRQRFPLGSVEFDSAFLMVRIAHPVAAQTEHGHGREPSPANAHAVLHEANQI